MKKVLFINPNYYSDIYEQSKVRAAMSRGATPLGLICAATPLLKNGHKVEILDLNLSDSENDIFLKKLCDFNPDIVGITTTTPTIYKAYEIAGIVKNYNRNIKWDSFLSFPFIRTVHPRT